MQLEFQDELSEVKAFNKETPSELALYSQSSERRGPSAITMYNQPPELTTGCFHGLELK